MFFLNLFSSNFSHQLNSYYQGNESYCQPTEVDLESHPKKYNFVEIFPEKKEELQQIFSNLQLLKIFQSSSYQLADSKFLENVGFKILNLQPILGLVLEDKNGWIIKKNFSQYQGKRIHKGIHAPCISKKFLPAKSNTSLATLDLDVYHDYRNPLRVEVVRRGRKWIKCLKLDRIQVAEEYLYYLPFTSDKLPLHQRTVVLSKKISILKGKANLEHYVYLALNHPEELKKIVKQICLFIKYTQLIDNHLDDICFLDDRSNRVAFVDCEPGNLSDVSQAKNEIMQTFDRGIFPIIGLRNLQFRLKKQLLDDGIDQEGSCKTQKIFDFIIDQMVEEVIEERCSLYKKIYKNFLFNPFISLVCLVSKTAFN